MAPPELVFTFVTLASALGMAMVVDMQRNHVFEDMEKYFEDSKTQSWNLFTDTYNEVKWELTHRESKTSKMSREIQ